MMRLLLVLLALLSGLSLTEVSASSAHAEVVGAASAAVLVASQERAEDQGFVKAQRPDGKIGRVRAQTLPASAPVRTISISISDRPRE
jgi:hypothetical protein